jgi:multiple sugar transport system ATP-binding protein
MDEPLSNLDAKLRVQMRTQVSLIQNRLHTTTVYVTHDQVEAMTLGDRVAVMRSGMLQQVDSPRQLYENPVNLFVAGFIGSPAMNFLPAEVDGDTLKLPIGDVRLSDEQRRAVESAKGRELIVGIRPEHFEDAALVGEQSERAVTTRAKVDVVESMGSELYVHFQVSGQASSAELEELAADAGTTDVPRAGDSTQAVARLNPESEVREGEEIELSFDPDRLYLFDPDGGRALKPAA